MGGCFLAGVALISGLWKSIWQQHLRLNIARPKKGDGPFPVVLCIHGGGFRAGKRESYDRLCIRVAQQVYVALTPSYRFAPKYPFPAAVSETRF
ncbi:MAG: alpha/beta hydrolase [Planctomycetota bacterium]